MTAEEFKIQVLPYKNKLFRFAKQLLRSREEAEDTVQEVYIKLWDRKQSLKSYRSIEAFAMTVTKNLCLDKLKSKRNTAVHMTEYEVKYEEKEPDQKAELKDAVDFVEKIIDQLPDLQKMVIRLKDIEGYEFEEISRMLEMNINAVRVNLSRARKKVRDELIKMNHYEFSRN